MIKIFIAVLLSMVELVLYYKFNKFVSYPARVLLYVHLATWYYQDRKRSASVYTTDKLFIWACVILTISPLPAYINDSIVGKVIEFGLLMLSQQFVIAIFLREGAKFNFYNQKKTFGKILVPYIIIPVLFFFFVALPTNQLIPLILFGLYILQMIYLSTLSAYAPFSEKSRFYLSLSMGLLIISSGANFLRHTISPYEYDFAVVRITSVGYRVFLLIALLHRETHVVQQSPYLR
jgi:lipoprotein signal peptidase